MVGGAMFRVSAPNNIITTYPINKNIKICRECKNYENQRCKLFVILDVVSGAATYIDATLARSSDQLCGVDASLYEDAEYLSNGSDV